MNTECPNCRMVISTPALKFLHEQVHLETLGRLGESDSLGSLPYRLFSRIALLMQDYADEQAVSSDKQAADALHATIKEQR